MDLLFKEYASPFVLLDSVIPAGRFNDFLDTFEAQREERQLWDFYINKLPPWDDRSFDDFRKTIKEGTQKKIERPSDEQLETTIKNSYEMLNNFEFIEGKGVDDPWIYSS